jgi:hypothetical protein
MSPRRRGPLGTANCMMRWAKCKQGTPCDQEQTKKQRRPLAGASAQGCNPWGWLKSRFGQTNDYIAGSRAYGVLPVTEVVPVGL